MNTGFYSAQLVLRLFYTAVKVGNAGDFVYDFSSFNIRAVCDRHNVVLHDDVVAVGGDVVFFQNCVNICERNDFVVKVIDRIVALRGFFDFTRNGELFFFAVFGGKSYFNNSFVSACVSGDKLGYFFRTQST